MMPPPPRPRNWDKLTDEQRKEHIDFLRMRSGEPPPLWFVAIVVGFVISVLVLATVL